MSFFLQNKEMNKKILFTLALVFDPYLDGDTRTIDTL